MQQWKIGFPYLLLFTWSCCQALVVQVHSTQHAQIWHCIQSPGSELWSNWLHLQAFPYMHALPYIHALQTIESLNSFVAL